MTQAQQLGPRQRALVEALRSGKYTQDTCQLRTTEGFCCLGVACDLYDPTKWVFAQEDEESDREWAFVITVIRERAWLPDKVREYYGFRTPTGEYNQEKFGRVQLSADNDRGVSFSAIADTIEAHASELFSEPL